MRFKTWRTRLSALALTLLIGGVAGAQEGGLIKRAEHLQNEPSARPTNSGSYDAEQPTNRRVPKTAEELFQILAGAAPAAETNETTTAAGKKRYLVCFLQTKRFAYRDEVDPETGEEIAKAGEIYDEPLWPYLEASYCAAGITLRSLGDFDEMLTVAGEYLNKEQVTATFAALAKQTNPGDEIFIYWNGHGGVTKDDDGDERDFAGGQTVSTAGGQSADGDETVSLYETNLCEGEARFRATSLTDDEVGVLFAKLKGRKVVAFFETCHSGGLATRDIFQARLVAPKPKTVATWAELKSTVDATGELLKAAGLEFALRGWKTGFVVQNAETDAAAPSNAPSNAPSDGVENTLRALLEASQAKDLTEQTLDKLAVAFTSGPNQNSWARTRYIDEEGNVRWAAINPGAFAIYASLRAASEAKRPLTFAQFGGVLRASIKQNSELANGIARMEGAAEEPQEATFLSNWDDATLYDPNWEFYVEEEWFQGGEKWRRLIEKYEAMENER